MGIDVQELQRRHGSRARRAPGQKASLAVDYDFTDVMRALDSITVAAGEHVRPAAQVAADVFYREVQVRAPISKKAHFFHGTHKIYGPYQPGNLRDSVYQVYSKDHSKKNKVATYHVSWNIQKAPYGFMVELGTSRAPAHAFVRPSYDAMKGVAASAGNDEFENRMAASLASIKA